MWKDKEDTTLDNLASAKAAPKISNHRKGDTTPTT
jgi:hypothetical protein